MALDKEELKKKIKRTNKIVKLNVKKKIKLKEEKEENIPTGKEVCENLLLLAKGEPLKIALVRLNKYCQFEDVWYAIYRKKEEDRLYINWKMMMRGVKNKEIATKLRILAEELDKEDREL